MEMGEFLIRFLGSFMFAIAILYAIFFYLKRNPAAMQLVKKGPKDPNILSVETMMALEPRKNLYIVKAGHERILISTSTEGTQFLSKLEPAMETASAEHGIKSEEMNQTKSANTLQEASGTLQNEPTMITFTPAVKVLFALWDGMQRWLQQIRQKLAKPSVETH